MKGTFKGSFIGFYQKSKSKKASDAILDIKITDGEIEANSTLINLSNPMTNGFKSFPIKNIEGLSVRLCNENELEKQFAISLKTLELFNYQLYNFSLLEDNRIQGTIKGDIYSYSVLNDGIISSSKILETDNEKNNEDVTQDAFTLKTGNESKQKPSIIIWSILIASISLFSYKSCFNKNKVTDIIAEKDVQVSNEQLVKEKQRKDSFNYYFNTIEQLIKNHQYEEALAKTEHIKLFATNADREKVVKEVNTIYTIQAEALVKKRKYKNAITIYTKLISINKFNLNYQYKRALCYSKLGKIKDAVNDLKSVIQFNDKSVNQLYNKINPVKKRVAYYVTRCCDGTTSNATGRGACSHHGGVCDWKEPVYEEYREYE